ARWNRVRFAASCSGRSAVDSSRVIPASSAPHAPASPVSAIFSANGRLPWPARARQPIVEGEAGIPGHPQAGPIMQQAVADQTAVFGALDDQLITRLLYQRIIVLGSEVDDRVANRLCAQLLLLSAEDARADISLYINSPGGSVSAGLAIYDTMRLIPNDVSTLAMGLAGSMAQFLLCAGTPGKRFSLPHAQVLMHQGSAGFGGTAADVEIYAAQLERTGALMTRLTAEH